ncbi:MAG: hypothetical protein ACREA4_11940, partial [Nitrososphaera sp.]
DWTGPDLTRQDMNDKSSYFPKDAPPVIGETSIETKLLYERLKQAQLGELIEYTELSKIAGRDVRGPVRYAMASARRLCERQDRMVFGVVRLVGLRRLDDVEIIGTQQTAIDHVRRTVRRSARRLSCVREFDSLSPEDQTRHNSYQCINALLAHTTLPPQVRRLEQRVAEMGRTLPLGQVLDELKK